MKTYSAKISEVKREWHVVDATDQTLGRMSTRIARLLMGKHKATYTQHLDTGDYVVVINAGKVHVTGNKLKQKIYYRHTGYPGGLRSINLEDLLAKHPTRVIENSVRGMLPHTRLGAQMFKKLKVYAGADHPHPVKAAE
jgi:large subunit ribosomal protein L13